MWLTVKTVFSVSSCVFRGAVIIRYYQKRREFPIHGRAPSLSLLLCISMLLHSLLDPLWWESSNATPSMRGACVRYLRPIFIAAVFGIYVVRCLMLLVQTKVQDFLQSYHRSTGSLDLDATPWFVKYRGRIRNSKLMLSAIFMLQVPTLIAWLVDLHSISCGYVRPFVLAWNFSQFAFWFVLLVLLLVQLVRCQTDNYGMLTEVKLECIIALICTTVVFLGLYVLQGTEVAEQSYTWGMLFTTINVLLQPMMVAKGSKTKRRQRISEPSALSSLKEGDLKRLLQDGVFRTYFMKFLVSEWSSENLLFHLKVQGLKEQAATSPGLTLAVTDLYHSYIQVGAPYQINISSAALRCFEKTMAAAEKMSDSEAAPMLLQALDPLDGEIIKLMDKDSRRRFNDSTLLTEVIAHRSDFSTVSQTELRDLDDILYEPTV